MERYATIPILIFRAWETCAITRPLELWSQPNHTNNQWQPDDEGFKTTAEKGQNKHLIQNL